MAPTKSRLPGCAIGAWAICVLLLPSAFILPHAGPPLLFCAAGLLVILSDVGGRGLPTVPRRLLRSSAAGQLIVLAPVMTGEILAGRSQRQASTTAAFLTALGVTCAVVLVILALLETENTQGGKQTRGKVAAQILVGVTASVWIAWAALRFFSKVRAHSVGIRAYPEFEWSFLIMLAACSIACVASIVGSIRGQAESRALGMLGLIQVLSATAGGLLVWLHFFVRAGR